MVSPINMTKWSKRLEEDLTILLKDWLKNQSKTQSDLRESFKTSSSRINVLLEVLKEDYLLGGIAKIADRLCSIEANWKNSKEDDQKKLNSSDPFNQLDLLLEELKKDINN